MHDLLDLALFVVPLVLNLCVLAVALCVAAARGDRQLREAWDEERERSTAALDDPESGLVIDFTPVYRNGWRNGSA